MARKALLKGSGGANRLPRPRSECDESRGSTRRESKSESQGLPCEFVEKEADSRVSLRFAWRVQIPFSPPRFRRVAEGVPRGTPFFFRPLAFRAFAIPPPRGFRTISLSTRRSVGILRRSLRAAIVERLSPRRPPHSRIQFSGFGAPSPSPSSCQIGINRLLMRGEGKGCGSFDCLSRSDATRTGRLPAAVRVVRRNRDGASARGASG